MSLEYFEQRPPRVVAMKLDFLDEPADEVVAKLRLMPGVYGVSVGFCEDGKRGFVVNPNVTKGRLEPDRWLVSLPNERTFDNELRLMTDEEFNEKYRPCGALAP